MKSWQNILDLKPTQFAIGMMEVDAKIEKLQKYSKKKLAKYIKKHVVPVVRSPENELYIVDRHHFLTVCYLMDIQKVKVELIRDFRKENISFLEFWEWMRQSRNTYPYSQFGEGPHSPVYLPADIRGLADDPYRSIAWFVRKAGAYENSEKYFAEFQWANFFRKKGLLEERGRKSMPEALKEAVRLARTQEATRLPGYKKVDAEEKKEIVENIEEIGEELSESDKEINIH